MSRKLNDFIDENRRAFDDDLPSASAWQQIEKKIAASNKVPATRMPMRSKAMSDIYRVLHAGFATGVTSPLVMSL